MQDVVTQHLSEKSCKGGGHALSQSSPVWMICNSELTPSESLATSDDEVSIFLWCTEPALQSLTELNNMMWCWFRKDFSNSMLKCRNLALDYRYQNYMAMCFLLNPLVTVKTFFKNLYELYVVSFGLDHWISVCFAI